MAGFKKIWKALFYANLFMKNLIFNMNSQDKEILEDAAWLQLSEYINKWSCPNYAYTLFYQKMADLKQQRYTFSTEN